MENIKIIYVSNGDWFDAGTKAELIADCRPQLNGGVFSGIKNGKPDEELCTFDEFTIREILE